MRKSDFQKVGFRKYNLLFTCYCAGTNIEEGMRRRFDEIDEYFNNETKESVKGMEAGEFKIIYF